LLQGEHPPSRYSSWYYGRDPAPGGIWMGSSSITVNLDRGFWFTRGGRGLKSAWGKGTPDQSTWSGSLSSIRVDLGRWYLNYTPPHNADLRNAAVVLE
jgi:hypothetical protein